MSIWNFRSAASTQPQSPAAEESDEHEQESKEAASGESSVERRRKAVIAEIEERIRQRAQGSVDEESGTSTTNSSLLANRSATASADDLNKSSQPQGCGSTGE